MFEQMPHFNNESAPKLSSEDMAAELLKIQGSEAPGFVRWINQERERLEKENPAEAEARLGAELARVYFKAGNQGEGLDRMRDVRKSASGISEEFSKEIEETIRQMERGEIL